MSSLLGKRFVPFLTLLFCFMSANAASSFGPGVQIYDPSLIINNFSSNDYILEWKNGTATFEKDNGMVMRVANHGILAIKPHEKDHALAHFYSLKPHEKSAPMKEFMFCIQLYDKQHQLVSQVHIVNTLMQKQCAVVENDIHVDINKQGIMTIVFSKQTVKDS